MRPQSKFATELDRRRTEAMRFPGSADWRYASPAGAQALAGAAMAAEMDCDRLTLAKLLSDRARMLREHTALGDVLTAVELQRADKYAVAAASLRLAVHAHDADREDMALRRGQHALRPAMPAENKLTGGRTSVRAFGPREAMALARARSEAQTARYTKHYDDLGVWLGTSLDGGEDAEPTGLTAIATVAQDVCSPSAVPPDKLHDRLCAVVERLADIVSEERRRARRMARLRDDDHLARVARSRDNAVAMADVLAEKYPVALRAVGARKQRTRRGKRGGSNRR